MKITNKYELPEALVKAVSRGSFSDPRTKEHLSVSDLISPPQIVALKRGHWGEMEEDASDRLWALLGQAVHEVLDYHSREGVFSEFDLEAEYFGETIRGRADSMDVNEGTLEDWKITSVWSYVFAGSKPEWEAQLNLYADLFRRSHVLSEFCEIKALKVHMILRDWKTSDAKRDPDYPQIPFVSVSVPLWEPDRTLAYIRDKIDDLRAPEPRKCTKEEKWERDPSFAVKKEGVKRAVRVFDTREAAEKCMEIEAKKNKVYIEERKGVRTRCESFCPVRDFCPQKREEDAENEGTGSEG